MANYPQLDDQVGVWKLKDVNSAVMGGYWRNGGSRALFGGGDNDGAKNVIDFINLTKSEFSYSPKYKDLIKVKVVEKNIMIKKKGDYFYRKI